MNEQKLLFSFHTSFHLVQHSFLFAHIFQRSRFCVFLHDLTSREKGGKWRSQLNNFCFICSIFLLFFSSLAVAAYGIQKYIHKYILEKERANSNLIFLFSFYTRLSQAKWREDGTAATGTAVLVTLSHYKYIVFCVAWLVKHKTFTVKYGTVEIQLKQAMPLKTMK